jgi:methylenetetrahydrofolate dehydrogenase (NADP+)/methenyltetrahydrofolate cyclohydrolase
MSEIIIDGKKLANNLCEKLKSLILDLKDHNIVPGLAIVLVGNDVASHIYVNNKVKKAKEIGINIFENFLPENTSEEEILELIESLNNNDKVNGIIVQLPLPKHINQFKVINKINYKKDVDGFTVENIGLLNSWQECLEPSTPRGILLLLKHCLGDDLSGKKAVVLGRSIIVGRPMTSLLIRESCTVTLLHSKSLNVERECKDADILISAIGQPNIITPNLVKQGACVIDVGINRVNDKLVGDVEFERVSKIVSYISPVPGGVGPMTVACMLENTIKALHMQKGINYKELVI